MKNHSTLAGVSYRAIFWASLCCATAAGAAGQDPIPPQPVSVPAVQPPSSEDEALGVIIVTAQKREQALNDVPLSVTAVSGDRLSQLGVNDTRDLAKVVPGFNYTESAFGTPVYTLRGVGFYETSIGAKPTVSIYVDEVPLPFSVLARGTTLDLQRVEVLKGPQGILFGQNATGGAINYIAGKPTREFSAGFDGTYARFNAVDVGGFVSGPLGDKLSARFAIKTQQGGAWQRSYTRDDKLGDRNFTTARLTFDFRPTDALKFALNLNGFVDKSDEVAAQLLEVVAFSPASVPFLKPELINYPRPPHNNRAADWTPEVDPSRNHRFGQASLRGEMELNDKLTLISITAYSDYRHRQSIDPDGVALRTYSYRTEGDIESLSQELRLSFKMGRRGQGILGGTYNRENVFQRDNEGPYPDTSAVYPLAAAFGTPPFTTYYQYSDQKFRTAAAFANIDYDLTDKFTVHAGARYTDARVAFRGCTMDDGTITGQGAYLGFGALLNYIRSTVGLPPVQIGPGQCLTINSPTLTFEKEVRNKLNEDNISWRAGLDYKPNSDTLFYLSASRGYKSGSFPLLSASATSQFDPVTQESVVAYEMGVKATILEKKAQLNAALFYYDYKDKQIKGRVIAEPNVFGPLEALVNIPKSSVKGAEAQLTFLPVRGLLLNIGATYLDTKIRGDYFDITSFGDTGNFGGEPFPYTPKYQVVADGQYKWNFNDSLEGMIGSNLTYQSKTNAAFGQLPIFKIDDYALVDFRAGIASLNHRWSATAFLRNAFDKYYWTNSTKITDTIVRYTGQPRTFGLSLSYRY